MVEQNQAPVIHPGATKPLYVRAPSGLRRAQKPTRMQTLRMRGEVYGRDGFACRLCGAAPSAELIERFHEFGVNPLPLELDHVVPYRDGGPFTLDNLQTLCETCNRRKGARA